MTIDAMQMARARLALRTAVGAFLFDRARGINAVDIGIPQRGGQSLEDVLAIRFHVDAKPSLASLEAAGIEPLPKMIGVFPSDVLVGRYRPHWWWAPWLNAPQPQPNPHLRRADPMRGGISISDEFHVAAGTLGGKVVDRATGAEMILSNWHVLVVEWTARRGQDIYQPGRLDGGTAADVVATLERDAMSVRLDAAVATLTGSRWLANDQLELWPVAGIGQAQVGMPVVKSGRSSGKTRGRVTGVAGIAKLTYGHRMPLERLIDEVITIEPDLPMGEVSRGGDSGSLWLDPQTRRAVGLHFAGNDFPERALAMDLQSVLDALQVDLAIERQPARPQAVRVTPEVLPTRRTAVTRPERVHA